MDKEKDGATGTNNDSNEEIDVYSSGGDVNNKDISKDRDEEVQAKECNDTSDASDDKSVDESILGDISSSQCNKKIVDDNKSKNANEEQIAQIDVDKETIEMNNIKENEPLDEQQHTELEDDTVHLVDYNVEDNNKIKSTKNIKKIALIIGGMLAIFVLVVAVTTSAYKNKVYPGASLCGVDLSKMDKEELNKEIKSISSKIEKNTMYIKASSKKYDIKISDLVEDYNINGLEQKIMNYGKEKNIFEKFMIILNSNEVKYGFDISVDKEKINKLMDDISKETNKLHENPKVIINGDDIKLEVGKDGKKLNENDLIKKIKGFTNKVETLDDNVSIAAVYEDDKPTMNINDLKSVDTKMSTYSTTYGSGGGRGSNVENAAKKLDDMILMPGEEFSYEKSVGPVELNNGYTYAPVIVNGELQNGVGGGVCQVSSTLYNTTLIAGILPTERRNHSKAVSYVPRGLDATLASGLIDYKFKNTYDYPLVLNTNTSGGKLTIEIWSNKDAKKGISYEAKGYASGNSANTYLYGYDKDGKKVFEKHIDTSVYR
ncbi:hypothetical protein CHL78_001900 [Romboutsia weinsteinii]|uniref:YoaR-like putative peptidoglycan binding domain-containing protein n=1 Tax=Romboutsia weinsteinii TaxID=2020949 RepID=A0A371J9P7_9FIRM|nr:VanW family protein [Romboutsia weinsteinii]RDY29479.1 hypothetical protein CHL78_001900 [Romboutsia weinsteinii]